METIFSLATAHGKAGVAVIRISGPDAWTVATQFCDLPAPRQAGLRRLSGPKGDVIDEALVLCFEAGASFTGEPVVEFQTHGSVAVIRAILAALAEGGLARMAQPGEFTRRALENGRLDLVQVEALGDLIEAETEAQRKQANRVLSGALAVKVETWRTFLIRAASLLAVTIDFADEEVPEDVSDEVLQLVAQVGADLSRESAGYRAAERIRHGFEVAIVGAPNVGKSTLLNALAGREAAITSEIAGTTRDVIEVRMDLAGVPVTLLDTAGVRETVDRIEQLGVDLARRRADQADLRVFVLIDEEPPFSPRPGDLVIRGKGDQAPDAPFPVSGLTGLGISRLVSEIGLVLSNRISGAGLVAHERQRVAVNSAIEHLEVAAELAARGQEFYDIAAEEIRLAIRALEIMVGRIGVEDLLDEIFANFCLGK